MPSSNSLPALQHRADIDGLRALAVIPVVLFHAGLPFISGGFVGVDVFFVISGFLITSIIVRELGEGRFTIAKFYERRVRRIFPALFVVLFACLAFCSVFFLPREFAEFARSLAGAAFFVSNIVFWQEVDYFGITADLKPLLHTWSLAIEEQFYIVFPLVLMAFFRFGRGVWRPFVVVVLLISLALCAWGTGRYPVATFYLALTRAWELMIGSVLASGVVPALRPGPLREAVAAVGVALIVASVMWIDEATAFPGLAALAPCLGTAFVIAAGRTGTTATGRLLSLRPVVFAGLISYSLYLWHWPLLVFAKYLAVRELVLLETAAIIGLSFLLATLSWRYVEQPFRDRSFAISRKQLFVAATVAMAALGSAGVAVSGLEGLPGRLDPSVVAWARQGDRPTEYQHCLSEAIDAPRLCPIGAEGVPATFALWGDSHAGALLPAIDAAAQRQGRAGYAIVRPGCGPILGARSVMSPNACDRFSEAAAQRLEAHPELGTLLIGGYWRRMATGVTYDHDGLFYVDDESTERSRSETRRVFGRSLERVLVRFADRRVYLIADAPEAGQDVPSVLARLALLDRDPAGWSSSVSLADHRAALRPAHDLFATFAERHDLAIVEVTDVLCRDGRCPLTLDGRVLYRDGDHLSPFGAMLLADRFASVLANGSAATPRRSTGGPGDSGG